jgi:DNA-binding response OmpR family regulator
MAADPLGKPKEVVSGIGAMHVLIIEDDLDLGPALLSSLRQEGVTGVWVRHCADAVAHLEASGEPPPDALLLDLSLPDGDGFGLLRRWRERRQGVPVLVISARATLEDRLAALDGGADDYLVKPFAMAELASRLRAVTRRCALQASERWHLGALSLSPRTHQAWLREQPLELSPREFRLLLELARSPDTLVSKSVLGRRLEPLGEPLDGATVEVHLSNLRRKIGAERIRTVRGVGYQLVP